MGDHFVLLVDRLLTESTLEATIESGNQSQAGKAMKASFQTEFEVVPQRGSCGNGSSGGKIVECRICQDEDEDCNMETPCSCCGSLKYAHRKCIQRWCNEKGDTMCEICLQQFKPGYTAPPQLFHYGSIPMNFRGNWEISRRDLQNPRLIAMVATDRTFADSNYDDYASSRSMLYCRLVAVIFMVLLVLRHTLPIIISGDEDLSFTLFTLLLLRIAGIVLPVYVMARALSIFQRRRRQPDTRELPVATSATEDEQMHSATQLQHSHLIHVP